MKDVASPCSRSSGGAGRVVAGQGRNHRAVDVGHCRGRVRARVLAERLAVEQVRRKLRLRRPRRARAAPPPARARRDAAEHEAQVARVAPVSAHEAARGGAELLARRHAFVSRARDERALASRGELHRIRIHSAASSTASGGSPPYHDARSARGAAFRAGGAARRAVQPRPRAARRVRAPAGSAPRRCRRSRP